uniref:Disease resistance R13L4/SHOC-2-like LRR domain-containing protein n=1 Tax=Chenopodium quinoa TaxID=63459 RepID=A0A803MTU5_CHEQI
MHDIALDVSGKEIFYATDTSTGILDKKVRHLHVYGHYSLFGKTQIRSHLHVYAGIMKKDAHFLVEAIVANCRFLRALDLRWVGIESLPYIGELLHLRYLDLSHNTSLQVLPKSFTKLYNLQTLKLNWCSSLRELPKDLSRLVKLRFLDVEECDNLTYMPEGMGKLSSLHRLSDFKVGGGGISSSWEQWFDSLDDLKALNKLKGRLKITIRWPKRERNIVKEDGDKREGLYMRNKEHLNGLYMMEERMKS